MAAKPAPPLQISCSTAAQTGDIYRAECDVAAFGGTQPESVQLMPIKGEGVRLVESTAPATKNGIGMWILTMEFTRQRPASLRFKAVFANGATIHVGALYDPFKNQRAEKPKKGRVVTDNKGNRVQEFPSQ